MVGCLALLLTTTGQAPYPVIAAAAAVLGAGSGATLLPTMTVALRDLEGRDTPAGTTRLALVQQLACGIGIAVVATAVTILVSTRVPTLSGGGIGAMLALPTEQRDNLADALASAVRQRVPGRSRTLRTQSATVAHRATKLRTPCPP